MFTRSLGIGVLGLVVSAAVAWASPGAFQGVVQGLNVRRTESSHNSASPGAFEGVVKGPNGKPYQNAEIHLVAKDGSSFSKITKTDANGHYAFGSVPGGMYQMTLFVNGSIKASINNARTQIGSPTQLNFDLKADSVAKQPSKKGTHMVYVPAETGSNLGGRWVEVPDTGNEGTPGADNVKKAGNDAIRQIQTGGAR